ncbi:hypothetical protein FSP39_003740 [Pinctada imbricata]|uniref:Uncharacterized protein n=1 Tax=Pinctada imbricata TaxID=66713 RepID=A0AA88Y1Y0_PINIB|nr:hypothetical protein FSP39_003740 [Pinctada imbricata]
MLSVDEDKVEAIVKHPGFHHSDFDVLGQPKLWQIMGLVVTGRIFAHHYPLDDPKRTFRDYEKLTEDRLTFLVTSELQFTKLLYDKESPKRPLMMKVQGGYIGNSSFNSYTSVHAENGELLISNINQVVSIDMQTRRPKPLPDWWKQKYAESAKNKPSLKIAKFEKPGNTGFYQVKVAWSDTDFNHHTTWSAYVRYVIDAAHKCQREGTLSNFDDNLKSGISKLELQYFGESLEGDHLDVFVWEECSNGDRVLRGDVHKDGKSSFQCTLKFF